MPSLGSSDLLQLGWHPGSVPIEVVRPMAVMLMVLSVRYALALVDTVDWEELTAAAGVASSTCRTVFLPPPFHGHSFSHGPAASGHGKVLAGPCLFYLPSCLCRPCPCCLCHSCPCRCQCHSQSYAIFHHLCIHHACRLPCAAIVPGSKPKHPRVEGLASSQQDETCQGAPIFP